MNNIINVTGCKGSDVMKNVSNFITQIGMVLPEHLILKLQILDKTFIIKYNFGIEICNFLSERINTLLLSCFTHTFSSSISLSLTVYKK